jgi:hypothetical protein
MYRLIRIIYQINRPDNNTNIIFTNIMKNKKNIWLSVNKMKFLLLRNKAKGIVNMNNMITLYIPITPYVWYILYNCV